MMTASLESLLLRLRDGDDREAWTQLVELVRNDVARVCRRVAGPTSLAEDAAQEAFLGLASRARTFRPAADDSEGRALAWVRCVAATTTLSLLRSRGRAARRERAAVDLREPQPEPHDLVTRRDLAERVRAALDELPQRERLILSLRFFADLGPEAIADELGCPAGTAKSRLNRSLQRLRALLLRRGVSVAGASLAAFLGAIDSAEGAEAAAPAAGAQLVPLSHPASWSSIAMTTAAASAALAALAWGALSWSGAPASETPTGGPTGGDAALVSAAAGAKLAWSDDGLYAPFSSITPVVAGDCVLAAGEQVVRCYGRDGSRRWSLDVDGYHHRPVVLDGLVVIAEHRRVSCRSLETGVERWTQPLERFGQQDAHDVEYANDASPLIVDSCVVVPCRDGRIHCFALADGTPLWTSPPPPQRAEYFSASAAGGLILCSDWGHAVEARRLESGEPAWRAEVPDVGANAPVVSGDAAYVVTHRIGAPEHGSVVALALADGAARWTTRLEQGVTGGPAVVDDVVVVAGQVSVIGLSRIDGHRLWETPRERFGYEHLIVDAAKRIVVGGGADERVQLLDHRDGHVLLSLPLMDHALASGAKLSMRGSTPILGQGDVPMPAAGRLYVTTSSGWFGVLELPGILPPAPAGHDFPAGNG
jgi:RNA polymerase sigma-70 factor (ECF subfamily)